MIRGQDCFGQIAGKGACQPFDRVAHPVVRVAVAEIALPFQIEDKVKLIGVPREDGFRALPGFLLVPEGENFLFQTCPGHGVGHGVPLASRVVDLVHIVEIAGSGFAQIVKEAEHDRARRVRAAAPGKRIADHRDAVRVLRDAFPACAEKGVSAPRHMPQHPHFVQKIGQTPQGGVLFFICGHLSSHDSFGRVFESCGHGHRTRTDSL